MTITSSLEKLAIKLQETFGSERLVYRTDCSNIYLIAFIIICSLILLAFSVLIAIYYWKHRDKKVSAFILILLGIVSSVETFLSSLISASTLIYAGMIGFIMLIFYFVEVTNMDRELYGSKETCIGVFYSLFGVTIMDLPILYLIARM